MCNDLDAKLANINSISESKIKEANFRHKTGPSSPTFRRVWGMGVGGVCYCEHFIFGQCKKCPYKLGIINGHVMS